MDTTYLTAYYDSYDEEGRLLSRHGQVEYLTTLRYLRRYLEPGMRILELGAGTGRYSLTLAHEGYTVDAVELEESNLARLRQGIRPTDRITAVQGNALDLSRYASDRFDLTLLLGPLYHLYTEEDKLTALREALRVTRPGGLLFVAYCMNDATVVHEVFAGKMPVQEYLAKGMLTEDYHCLSKPEDLFELVRTEDIEALDRQLPAERLAFVATDGATNYMRPVIDAMDDETFARWLDYHFHTCERPDLIGASHHTLDILRKRSS